MHAGAGGRGEDLFFFLFCLAFRAGAPESSNVHVVSTPAALVIFSDELFFLFSSTGKNVSFLAASASRAAIHNVLSLKGNLADVTAKAGAQTILACMVGENQSEE